MLVSWILGSSWLALLTGQIHSGISKIKLTIQGNIGKNGLHIRIPATSNLLKTKYRRTGLNKETSAASLYGAHLWQKLGFAEAICKLFP